MFDGALFFSGHDLYVTTNASIYLYTVELQDDEIVDVSELYCSAAVEDIIYRYNAVGVDLTEEEAENILDCTDETPHVDDGGELDWYVQGLQAKVARYKSWTITQTNTYTQTQKPVFGTYYPTTARVYKAIPDDSGFFSEIGIFEFHTSLASIKETINDKINENKLDYHPDEILKEIIEKRLPPVFKNLDKTPIIGEEDFIEIPISWADFLNDEKEHICDCSKLSDEVDMFHEGVCINIVVQEMDENGFSALCHVKYKINGDHLTFNGASGQMVIL